jgi:hypothetical protein
MPRIGMTCRDANTIPAGELQQGRIKGSDASVSVATKNPESLSTRRGWSWRTWLPHRDQSPRHRPRDSQLAVLHAIQPTCLVALKKRHPITQAGDSPPRRVGGLGAL